MLLMHIKHSLAKHAFQEENVVYPSLRDHGAAEAADHLNSEHGYVKQYLFDLHMMPKDDPAWMTKIREFRSEEHTSELQSLMRISYAVFCLKKYNFLFSFFISLSIFSFLFLHFI